MPLNRVCKCTSKGWSWWWINVEVVSQWADGPCDCVPVGMLTYTLHIPRVSVERVMLHQVCFLIKGKVVHHSQTLLGLFTLKGYTQGDHGLDKHCLVQIKCLCSAQAWFHCLFMTMSHIYIAVYFGFWRCLQESAAFLRLEKNYNENLWLSFEKKPERGYRIHCETRAKRCLSWNIGDNCWS